MQTKGKPEPQRLQTDGWGIDNGYVDSGGRWHATSPKTHRALLESMGVTRAGRGSAPPHEDSVCVIRVGERIQIPKASEVELESGEVLPATELRRRKLPLGYHRVHRRNREAPVRLIVCPPHCHLPSDLKVWGWSAQLYATRSKSSWGIGDLADLQLLARWSVDKLGAGMLLVNPLLAPMPIPPIQPSPYYPSSRRFRDPIYLRIENVPGFRRFRGELGALAKAGRELNRTRVIDRDHVFELKLRALEKLWGAFGGDVAFERYCAEQGEQLEQFATFCVLAERFGSGWREWPVRFRHPSSPDVLRLAGSAIPRMRFHCWLQWLLDQQLRRAADEASFIFDLPIGFDPNGADAWAWQDLLAEGARIGAPPDTFNTLGQDWGLPPFIPHKFRAAGYDPFIQTIRASLRHGGGLRIDHVMGLFRLYWIPPGAAPSEGAYVRYPHRDLLGIVALESVRAGAVVAGEDLGTVEPGVGRELKRNRMLSYRVLWFETKRPAKYPKQSLAAVTTHDLPTIAGMWTGEDLKEQERLGLSPNKAGLEEQRQLLVKRVQLPPEAPVPDVVVRTHELLAQAPSHLIAATLDDALGLVERPNMPGTTSERPNWALALPEPLENFQKHPLVGAVANALAQRPPAKKTGHRRGK